MISSVNEAGLYAADYLIVGAGAVGLSLGIRLAKAGKNVIVLEAGNSRPPKDYRRDNQGPSTGHYHRGLTEGRMRALGGTTRLWGGQLVAFGELDFDGVPTGEPSRWPIRFAQMTQYIHAAFRFLGVPEQATDQEAVWLRATKKPPTFGPDLRLGMNIWLPEPDFTRLFAKPIAARDGPRVITDAEVTRLVFDMTGRKVTAVQVKVPDGSTVLFSAPKVVLANGTLEISRMLLRMAALEPNCAFANNQHLGRHFIDHIHGLAGEIKVLDASTLSLLFDNIYVEGLKFGVKLRASNNLRNRTGMSNCAATLNPAMSIGAMVRELPMLAGRILGRAGVDQKRAFGDIALMARITLPLAWRYLVDRRSTSILSHGVSLGVELEQLPTSRSYLFLDPAEAPETASIGIHWDFDGRELDAAAALCTAIDAQFRREGLGSIDIDSRILSRNPAFFADCHDSYHQMGGARIAESAEEGVVDRDLLVFGTENLYILGAAIFPAGSFANPTLTAIAFALRLAEHLECRQC